MWTLLVILAIVALAIFTFTRRYDNNHGWVFRFQDGPIHEVREYMDTQLVTDTFGADDTE